MSETPPCVGCGASVDCDQPDQYAFSLTGDPTLPFVLNCPIGFDCNQALTLKLNCCGHILSAVKPANATPLQVSNILFGIITQCQSFNSQCALILPANNIIQNTIFTTVGTCTIFCPDGSPFTFTTPQELYLGVTQQQADLFAHMDACRLAPQHLICIGTLPATLPEFTAFSQKLLATGFLATFPQQNLWDITGDIPTGMTFTDGFFSTGDGPTLTGTPTSTGPFTFTVKVTNPNGDFQTKNFTITITGAPPAITYFAFEQSSGNFIDSANGLALPRTGFTNATGLIASGITATTGSSFTTTTSTLVYNKAASAGITIWCWLNIPTHSASLGFLCGINTSTPAMAMGVSYISGTSYTAGIQTTFGNSSATINPILGSWNLFVISYDLANHVATLYWNTGAIATVTFAGSPFANGNYPYQLLLGGGPTIDSADESGIIMNRAATAAQVASLYNGGAGVTWPAAQTIFT